MTSERLEESLQIDQMSAADIVRVITRQDRTVADAVAKESERIAQAIDLIADRLHNGGRLFYAGAGTSGRIAMLDAAEIPPTYGTDPSLVQVLMAGGREALFAAVEGAEDREEDAISEVGRSVRAEDAVVGVAASGTTPYTVAAVRKANMIGALTVGVTSVHDSPLARECDIPIVTLTGPEVIMGSSRMKSGTAQKLVLNTISTGVMIRLGRVFSNLMIEMPATNEKLRRRAVRMVELASGKSRNVCEEALTESGGRVKQAIVIAIKGLDRQAAERLLEAHGGRLREVISD